MDPKQPPRRNIFLIATVILFNLIWLTLLFMSCQADEHSLPDPAPVMCMDSCQIWKPGLS